VAFGEVIRGEVKVAEGGVCMTVEELREFVVLVPEGLGIFGS
jgi:hypothetical protein